MMRIASLLPSASEIVCDIGLKDNLVAISHECNYPKSLEGLKVVTNSSIDSNQEQLEIDTQVRKKVQSKLPLYEINAQLLNELKPDVIITQGLCDVCAISSSEIEVVLKGTLCTLPSSTQIISLNGKSFKEICSEILKLGEQLDAEKKAKQHVDKAIARRDKLDSLPKYSRKILSLEWIDPYFSAGHWVPEQIEIAGFRSAIGQRGEHSRVISIEEIIESDPDDIAVICCGYKLHENKAFAERLKNNKEINFLKPFKENKIYSFDSDAYFSRPTTRLIEGAQQLRNAVLS